MAVELAERGIYANRNILIIHNNKVFDSTLDCGKEDNKQESDPTEINNNVIINININNGKDHD